MISFRGPTNFENRVTKRKILMIKYHYRPDDADPRVHKGFYKAYLAIAYDMLTAINMLV